MTTLTTTGGRARTDERPRVTQAAIDRRTKLFNGVCANCHGSVSGLEDDIAANPDILTRASAVVARGQEAADLTDRGGVEGPEFP